MGKKYRFDFVIILSSILFVTLYVYTERCRSYEKGKLDDIYLAIFQFENGDYQKALSGDNTIMGFWEFVNKYRGDYKALNIAKMYIGISLVKLKDYTNGIEILKNLEIKEPLINSKILNFIGNTFVNMKQYDKAIEYFRKAANCYKNDIDNPLFIMNIVYSYEELGKYGDALEIIEDTIKKYPDMEMREDFIKEKKKIESKKFNVKKNIK